ncbi:MAG: caspase family protein [Hydrococcus sp. Prado102]|nr:caspase family protein [Hydrococcus sp. Prado102]
MPEFTRNMAFVIGINNYQNGISPLQNAVNDAKKLIEILREKHGYQVWVCLDEVATLNNLNNLLEQTLPRQVEPNDRLLFYFAGHGIALNGEDGPMGYLIPQDAILGDTQTYLPMTKLQECLENLSCRHFLGILDCCFAGAFRWSSTRDLLTTPEVIHQERYDRFITDPAWQVITSAASDQKALDAFNLNAKRGSAGDHSPFAAALFEALEGGADLYPPAKEHKPSGDGVITATELYLYLRDRIETATQSDRQRQTPGIWSLKKHDKGEYIFLSPEHELNLPPAPPLDESQNPYRGLESYDEEHSHLFFGRQALTEELYQRICKQPLTVVLGASGTGKSSLVKAGLIPYIKKEKKQQWRVLTPMRPGESPFMALNNLQAQENSSVSLITDLTTEQKVEPFSVKLATWIQLNPQLKLLLAIDQLEELITLCRNEQERESFLKLLAGLIAKYPEQLRIVLTLRSDFEPQFRNSVLETYWNLARFIVPAMTREELRSCIEEPATKRVLYFEPYSLVDDLIDEVVQMPGALPLLSFTLSELYLKYLRAVRAGKRNNRAILQEDYEELGGVTRSLTQRADLEYEALVKQDKAYAQTIRNVMLRAIAVGSGELARRRVPLAELEYPESENERVKTVIRSFSAARLLVEGQDMEGKPYVEPAHDALVLGWQRLLAWKREEEENLILQRRLTSAAQEWKNVTSKETRSAKRSRRESQFLAKVEPLLAYWDRGLDAAGNFYNQIDAKIARLRRRNPNQQDALHSQAAQFLWNANPYLDVLKERLNFNRNWFNQIEAEFVERSIFQKRRNVNLRWSIAIGVILGLSGLTIYALINQRQAQIEQANASRETAEAYLRANQSLDGMLSSLQAGKSLQSPLLALFKPGDRLQEKVRGTLQRAVYTVKELNRIEGHQGTVRISLSPDGKLLVSAGEDGTVRLWNLQGRQLAAWNANQVAIANVSFSPNGQILATVGDNGTVRLWNLQGQSLAQWQGHRGRVKSVSFSPNGQLLATAGNDATIRLWNLQGLPLAVMKGHTNEAWSVSFSPDGQTLVSASEDGTIRLWNLQGQQLAQIEGNQGAIDSIKFSPNGQILATAGEKGTVRLWNLQGQLLRELKGHQGRVWSLIFSRDGQRLASAGEDGTVRLWNFQRLLLTLKGHQGPVRSVSFSSDGQTLISAGDDGTVRLWNLQGQYSAQLLGHQGSVRSVIFSPDGQMLATGGEDATIRLWNAHGQLMTEFKGDRGSVRSVNFSPNGQILASAEDNTVRLWDLQGQPLAQLKGHQDLVRGVNFSPEGQLLVSAGDDGTVRLWDLQGQLLTVWKADPERVWDVAFSQNGQILATAGADGTVRLWNLQGRQMREMAGHIGPVYSVAFSPNGKQLASAGADGTIRLRDVQENRNGKLFQVYNAEVNSVAFAADGKMLVSGDNKGNVQLWDLQNQQQFSAWSAHQDSIIRKVSLSKDGKLLATAADDGTARLWQIELFDELINRIGDRMSAVRSAQSRSGG